MQVIRAGLTTGIRLVVGGLLLVGFMGFASAAPAAAAGTAVVNETLNVRTGPAATYRVLGTVREGQRLTTLSSAKGWTKIEFRRGTGFVSSRYLTTTAAAPAAPTKVTPGTVRAATTVVNVRKGAGTTYAVARVLAKGARVTMSGRTSGTFAEVVNGTGRAWVAVRYLTPATGLPAVVSTRVATAALDIRSSPADRYTRIAEVPKGTRLSITGVVTNGRAQVVFQKAARWVTARYLALPPATRPTVPGLPAVAGTRYATADLNVRATSSGSSTVITTVPRGTALSITGVTKNKRTQIVYAGAVRWVAAQYLSKKRPAVDDGAGDAVERGLKPNAIKVHRAARVAFPQITTIYGVRADSIPDHPSGRALDLMIPGYKTVKGKALGAELAAWARTNARSLGIQYVIWNQRIWNIQRDHEGWRYMANRGGDSANHKNHVHITVYG